MSGDDTTISVRAVPGRVILEIRTPCDSGKLPGVMAEETLILEPDAALSIGRAMILASGEAAE